MQTTNQCFMGNPLLNYRKVRVENDELCAAVPNNVRLRGRG